MAHCFAVPISTEVSADIVQIAGTVQNNIHKASEAQLEEFVNCCDVQSCQLCKEVEMTIESEHILDWISNLRDWEISIKYAKNQDQMIFELGADHTEHRIKEIRNKLGILQTQSVRPYVFSPSLHNLFSICRLHGDFLTESSLLHTARWRKG